MNNEYQPAGRSARWRAGLVALNLLGAGAAWAAEAVAQDFPAGPVFDLVAVDAAPVLELRTDPRPPRSHQPLFGAQLQFEFVVDSQGQPANVNLLEAKATLAETGKVVQASDLPALRNLGLLDGIPQNATFKETSDLITRPFISQGRDAVIMRRYRPGRKAGVAVATRLTDTVVFQADELVLPAGVREAIRRPSPPRLVEPEPPASPPLAMQPAPTFRPQQIARRAQPSTRPDAGEPTDPEQAYVPPATNEPARSFTPIIPVLSGGSSVFTPGEPQSSVMAMPGGSSTIFTPGQAPTTVLANAGGGSTIFTPGQPTTTVINTPGGGSTIYTPGQPPTTVVATGGGGSTIFTPGQPPSTVVAIPGGGSIIYTPGQPPVTVMPNQ